MEMVLKVEGCVKGIDLHRLLPCWFLLGVFFADFIFLLANLGFFFFFREPSKREGVRVLERERIG